MGASWRLKQQLQTCQAAEGDVATLV
uniref:Uncharacterized protein n=1 Tax=Zea mays TaxID=4577 RepID=C4J893_MAIZE|nr:unknown [Zea mays]